MNAANNLIDELRKAQAKVDTLNRENIQLKDTLQTAVDEICKGCGRYIDEHIGACDRCKWHKVGKGNLI